MYLVDHLHQQRHRRHPRLGAVALPDRRARPRLLRRHAPLRARRPAAGLPPRLEAAASSTTAATRCAASCISSALFWLDKLPRRRPARRRRRVDALPRLLAQGGRVDPEPVRRPREPRGDRRSCGSSTRTSTASYPDVQTIAEESTAWPMVSRPTYVGGLGLRPEVGHGLDARHARTTSRSDPVHRQLPPQRAHVPRCSTPSRENFVLPLSHDEVVHGKGSLLGKMPGDDWQKFANLRLLLRLHVRAAGQEAAVHGRRVRPVARVEPRRAASTGTCSTYAPHAGVQRWVARPQPRSTAASRRCTSCDCRPGGLRVDRRNDAEQSALSFLRRGRDGRRRDARGVSTSRRCRATTTASACRAAATGARCSTATPTSTAAAGMGNLGGVEAAPVPMHGRPLVADAHAAAARRVVFLQAGAR